MMLPRLAVTLADQVCRQRLAILIFHRVLPERDTLFPDELDAPAFDALMRLVARSHNVMPLGHAIRLQAQGALPPRSLSITFDDGYADNAEIALPILQRHGLTATFFVATGFLDGGIMFNDVVIETLRATTRSRIDLSFAGLGVYKLDDVASRRRVIDRLLPLVKYAPLTERVRLLVHLRAAAGDPALPGGLMMRSPQVNLLHKSGMEVGGHTANHPILRLLTDDEARRDIIEGRERLQLLIDADVRLFAYPNGRPNEDYTARDVDLVRQAGFEAAVTTAAGVVTPSHDRWQLPRYTPWDRRPWRWLARMAHQRLTGGSNSPLSTNVA